MCVQIICINVSVVLALVVSRRINQPNRKRVAEVLHSILHVTRFYCCLCCLLSSPGDLNVPAEKVVLGIHVQQSRCMYVPSYKRVSSNNLERSKRGDEMEREKRGRSGTSLLCTAAAPLRVLSTKSNDGVRKNCTSSREGENLHPILDGPSSQAPFLIAYGRPKPNRRAKCGGKVWWLDG